MTVELLFRLGLALTVAVCGAAFKLPPGDLGWQSALVYGVLALGIYGHDYWKKRRNSGIAGFVAVFDALFIAIVLSGFGELERYGFLVLAPMLWATGRYSSDAASMAPLVAATVMVSSNFYRSEGFTVPVMLHTLGILVVGLLTNQAKVVVKEREIPIEVTREIEVESAESHKIRESYATLKSHITELEASTKRERLGMKLWAAANGGDEQPITAMAGKLREESALEGVAVYALDTKDRRLVIAGVSGKVPTKVRHEALTIGKGLSEAQMMDRLTRQISELRDAERAVKVRTLILKSQGKACGCLAFFDPQATALEEAANHTKPALDYMGGLVTQVLKKDDESRRLREAEILYGIASVTIGAESTQNLIARAVREIGDVLGLDHLAAYLTDGEESSAVATVGTPNRVMESLSFAYGPGFNGWQLTNFPEVLALDALDDDRLDRADALKMRIGSLVLLPISNGESVVGYVTASTSRVGGIDRAKLETLRAVVTELGQAVGRQLSPESTKGVMTPAEFYGAVRAGGEGHFVYVDLVNRESVQKEFGKPALDLAMRKLTHRLRAMLPARAGVCRRDEGDYVVFLAGMEDGLAQKWGNEAAAALNGLNLTTPDGRHRLGLTIRAKVATFRQQNSQVSVEKAS
jgi:GGDEF domain-containing protein